MQLSCMSWVSYISDVWGVRLCSCIGSKALQLQTMISKAAVDIKLQLWLQCIWAECHKVKSDCVLITNLMSCMSQQMSDLMSHTMSDLMSNLTSHLEHNLAARTWSSCVLTQSPSLAILVHHLRCHIEFWELLEHQTYFCQPSLYLDKVFLRIWICAPYCWHEELRKVVCWCTWLI